MTRLTRTPFTVHEIGKAVAAARLTFDLAVLAIRKDAEPYLPHGAYWQNATYDTEDGCFKLSYRWAHMTHMLLMIDSDGGVRVEVWSASQTRKPLAVAIDQGPEATLRSLRKSYPDLAEWRPESATV